MLLRHSSRLVPGHCVNGHNSRAAAAVVFASGSADIAYLN